MRHLRVACDLHGEASAAFVCTHISRGVGCGFFADEPTAAEPYPDAWCAGCDRQFQANAGVWPPGQPQIAVECQGCYVAARERNREVPAWARAPLEESLTSLLDGVRVRQEVVERAWPWQRMARWNFNMTAGTMTFEDPLHPTFVADVVLVATWTDQTAFRWGWDSLGQGVEIERVRVFGEVHEHPLLVTPRLEISDAEAWALTAVAAELLGADAVHSALFGPLRWFMLLRNFR